MLGGLMGIAGAVFRIAQFTVHRVLPQDLHPRALELRISPQVRQRTKGALTGFLER